MIPRRLREMPATKKVVSIGALIIAFAIALTLSVALRRYNAELVNAAEELRTIDLLLATEAGRSLQSVQLVLDNVADQAVTDRIGTPDAFVERYSSEAVHEALRARVTGVPQLDAITIVNASGKLINFSRPWPIPDVNVSDREYFQYLEKNRTDTPYLSEPVINRGSGTPTIYLARRVSAPDGAFLGLVLAAIELRYFEDFYRSLRLGPGNVIALWRRDGVLLAHYPPARVGQRIATSEITSTEPAFYGASGVFEKERTIDNGPRERRIVAAQEVEGFPVQVNFARSKALILGDWWREFVAIGSAVSLAVICLIVLIWALIRRIHAYEAVAAASRDREKADLARQQAEEALRQAQKMEAVGQLTGGVAHDFNNLLTVVQSSLDLLRRANLTDERRTRYIDAIEDASNRAVKLTGQLLAFARRQALRPQVFDANDNVTAVGGLIDRLTGSRVTVEILADKAPCLIKADPNQFDTSVVNLAVNARDAMENGGRLDGRGPGGRQRSGHRWALRPDGIVRRCFGQRHRKRHSARAAGPRLRTVLHHQAGGPGDGPRAFPSVRLRQAIRRRGHDEKRGRTRHHRDALSSAGVWRKAGQSRRDRNRW